jgi:hypothetical protein
MQGRWLVVIVTVVLLLVAIIAGWVEIQHGFSARDSPTALEAFIARKVPTMAVPSSAKNESNPYTSTPETLADARRHFANHCAICHRNNGRGNITIGRNLYPGRQTCICQRLRTRPMERSTTSSTTASG